VLVSPNASNAVSLNKIIELKKIYDKNTAIKMRSGIKFFSEILQKY